MAFLGKKFVHVKKPIETESKRLGDSEGQVAVLKNAEVGYATKNILAERLAIEAGKKQIKSNSPNDNNEELLHALTIDKEGNIVKK